LTYPGIWLIIEAKAQRSMTGMHINSCNNIGGIQGQRVDPQRDALRKMEGSLVDAFEHVGRERNATDAAKAVAGYGKLLLQMGHAATVEDLQGAEVIKNSLSATVPGPVGAALAEFALKASGAEKNADKSSATLHWGFYSMEQFLPKGDPQRALAGLGWELHNTFLSHTTDIIPLQKSIMDSIAAFIPGPSGPIIAKHTYDALPVAKNSDIERAILTRGFTSILEGEKADANESPSATAGGDFVRKVGIPRAQAILKELADSPGASSGSVIAQAVLGGLESCTSDADRESLLRTALSSIQMHPEARDYEKTLGNFVSGLRGTFPPAIVADIRQTFLETLRDCRGGTQGRVVGAFFEKLEPILPHDRAGRMSLGKGFELILSSKDVTPEHKNAAEKGMAISLHKDLDDEAAITKMTALFREIKRLPGNELEREAARLEERLQGDSGSTFVDIEDDMISIDGVRLSVNN
jgi:hypothetical protein